MLEILIDLYAFILSNVFLLSFFSGMISEEIVIFLSILAGKGEFSIILVFLGGITGSLFIDQIYYIIGKCNFIEILKKKHFIDRNIKKLPNFIKKFGERNMFIEIFITKFIYGTRAAAIISLGHKRINYKKFFISDFLAIICWAIIMLSAAFFAGRGINFFLSTTKRLEKFLFISILLVLIYYLVIKSFLIPYLSRKKSPYIN